MKQLISFLLVALCLFGCDAAESVREAIDTIDVDRKPIDVSRTGVNAFGNDRRFGDIPSQYREVRDTLGLGFVRVLFNWDDNVQPTPDAAPNFEVYDNILRSIPAGMDVVAVIAGIPSWMSNPANWVNGNPRTTFIEKWARPIAARYADNGKLSALQIWNEPNMEANPENGTMQFATNPALYAEMLTGASAAIKRVAPRMRVLNAATTAINQNFPGSLDYNKTIVESGALAAVDVYAIHYYGKQYERVVTNGGVADFLNGLGKPIWVTESGAQGVNSQLAYVEQAWPFLLEKIPSIQRFYYYQFTEATPPETTYGLRNLSATMPVSDLYIYLRDR